MTTSRFSNATNNFKPYSFGLLVLTGLLSSNIYAASSLSKNAIKCDQLAAVATNPDNPSSVVPVTYEEMDAKKAISACTQAMADYPQIPRFQFQLARAFDKNKQYVQALRLYQPIAEQGYAPAQSNLGTMYGSGKGVQQSNKNAIQWYQRAANQGYAIGQNNLATHYQNGTGVQQDFKKASELYKKSADQGYYQAQYNLGSAYFYGKGVHQSYPKAVEWYERAAGQKSNLAAFNLGVLYEKGDVIPLSYDNAIRSYTSAANRGYGPAQINLGALYKEGIATPPF